MNKRDLLLALEKVGDDEEIYFMYPYGDFAGHMIIEEIHTLDDYFCRWSNYTNSMVLDNQDDTDPDSKLEWVLS